MKFRKYRLDIHSPAADPAALRELGARAVATYFDESAEPDEWGIAASLSLPEEALARFDRDFERLLSLKHAILGLRRAAAFRAWWRESRAAYLTRPAIASYRESGLTIGELLDDLHLHFVSRESAAPRHGIARWARSRVVMTLTLALAMIASKGLVLLWSLLVLGPGVQMVNSYTSTVITPLAQTAMQQGSRDLGRFASTIQSWLSQREKLAEVQGRLRETTERLRQCDFKRLPPEQAKARWARFEKEYFDLFLSYNQTLPAHLRDGRAFLKEWMVFITVGLASNLSVFDTQYWTHRRAWEALDARRRASGKLGARESAELAAHRREMEAAQSRIAGALAAWRLYDFMYPEYAGRTELRQVRQAFTSSMRFDLYVERFASAMDELLRRMETELPPADDISRFPARTSGRTADPPRLGRG